MPVVRMAQPAAAEPLFVRDTGELYIDANAMCGLLDDIEYTPVTVVNRESVINSRLDYLEHELHRLINHSLDDAFRDAAEKLRRLAQEYDLRDMSDSAGLISSARAGLITRSSLTLCGSCGDDVQYIREDVS